MQVQFTIHSFWFIEGLPIVCVIIWIYLQTCASCRKICCDFVTFLSWIGLVKKNKKTKTREWKNYRFELVMWLSSVSKQLTLWESHPTTQQNTKTTNMQTKHRVVFRPWLINSKYVVRIFFTVISNNTVPFSVMIFSVCCFVFFERGGRTDNPNGNKCNVSHYTAGRQALLTLFVC